MDHYREVVAVTQDPTLVWRYIPRGLYSHVIPDPAQPYERALCGVAPLAHQLSHDLWRAEPEQDRPQRCPLCTARLAALTELGELIELTEQTQEGRFV